MLIQRAIRGFPNNWTPKPTNPAAFTIRRGTLKRATGGGQDHTNTAANVRVEKKTTLGPFARIDDGITTSGGVPQTWRDDGAGANYVHQVFGGSRSSERHGELMLGSDRASIDRKGDRPLAQIEGGIPASGGVPQV